MRVQARWQRFWLPLLFVMVAANYLAQIVYYLHLYALPHGLAPSLAGTVLLVLTYVWFQVGYLSVRRGNLAGYWLLLSYLIAMVGFYAVNMFRQVRHGYAPFFHLQNHDPILFVVFAIGYLNLLGGAAYLVALLLTLLRHPRPASVTGRQGER